MVVRCSFALLLLSATAFADVPGTFDDPILELGIRDRRCGYPLETLLRAAEAGWRVTEHPVTYHPRDGGRSKVSGSVRGTVRVARDFAAVLAR